MIRDALFEAIEEIENYLMDYPQSMRKLMHKLDKVPDETS